MVSGAILPTFMWLFGDVFDAFGPDNDPEKARDEIRKIFLIYALLGLALLITATLQHALLASASAQIASRIKQKYLAAILKQESGWFDMIQYTELSSRLSKECASI